MGKEQKGQAAPGQNGGKDKAFSRSKKEKKKKRRRRARSESRNHEKSLSRSRSRSRSKLRKSRSKERNDKKKGRKGRSGSGFNEKPYPEIGQKRGQDIDPIMKSKEDLDHGKQGHNNIRENGIVSKADSFKSPG